MTRWKLLSIQAFVVACLTLGSTGCSYWTDMSRESAVEGIINCIQEGNRKCIANLTCSSYEESVTIDEIFEYQEAFRNMDASNLAFVRKTMLGSTERYVYRLEDLDVQVTFCPSEFAGTVAILAVGE